MILYFFINVSYLFKLWVKFLNINLTKLQLLSLFLFKEVKYKFVAPNSLLNVRAQATPNGT